MSFENHSPFRRTEDQLADLSALTTAMNEYASAIRGDWSDFDGRSERTVIESWTAEIQNPTGKTLHEWRLELGLCLDGNGHWHGRWGGCDKDCPTHMAEEAEWLKETK